MNKTVKIIAIIIAVLIGSLIITPYFFKDKIAESIRVEINNSIDATVDFKDVSLNLFSDFPNFTFSIKEFSVIGKNDFESKVLFKSEDISLTLDLSSVISGNYTIKSILINNLQVNLLTLKDGKTNWDIAIEEDNNTESKNTNDIATATKSESSEELRFAVELFEIKNANISYIDKQGNISSILNDFSITLSGNFTENDAIINLNSSIKEMSVKMDGINYFTKADVNFDAKLISDLEASKYTFEKNKMEINDVILNFDGYVAMPDDNIYTDLTFNSSNNSFKSFISLIPAFYMDGYEDIKTSGDFNISGWAKGVYNEKEMPSFNINMSVKDASFQYPDLPKSVNNINISTTIVSKTSDLDDMVIDVSEFECKIANNPLSFSMILKTPLSDPNLDAKVKCDIKLSSIKDVIPMDENMDITGQIVSNISIKGKQSDLDKGRYNKFNATGLVRLININYKDKDLPSGIIIHKASMRFSPRYISVDNFTTTYNKNTIELNGKVSNYFGYALNDGTLNGQFKFYSKYINFNDFIEESSTIQNTNNAELSSNSNDNSSNTTSSAIVVPSNINISMQCIIGRVRYEDINIRTIYGKLRIKDSKIKLNDLKMDMLGGKMKMNGTFSTVNPDTPTVNFVLGMQNFKIKKTYKAMNTIQKLAPIMAKVTGDFSTIIVYNSKLKQNLDPDLATVNASGILSTSKLTIKGSESIEKLADELKVDELRVLTTTPMNIPFKITDGNLLVKEFKTTVDEIPVTFGGTTKLNQDIDYNLRMEVPREKIGSDANSAISKIEQTAKSFGIDVSVSNTIIVKAKIVGTTTKPEVKLDFAKGNEEATDAVKDKAKEESKEEADKQIDNASKEADKQIDNSDMTDEEKEKARELKKKLEEEARKLLDLW